jgi:hypothetical protein
VAGLGRRRTTVVTTASFQYTFSWFVFVDVGDGVCLILVICCTGISDQPSRPESSVSARIDTRDVEKKHENQQNRYYHQPSLN